MIIIGTRGSDLALTQARHVASLLAQQGVATHLEIIRTQGDAVQNLSLDKLEGKGFFTKEIEDALLQSRVDLAVHSLKDLPTESPPGLEVVAIPTREDARDCLIVRPEFFDPTAPVLPLPLHARVGTSAVRRRAQLLALRPDLQIVDLRGNVPTRLAKLQGDIYHGIVLAQAGLNRLNLDLSACKTRLLEPDKFVPAPAQGALGLQIRVDDTRVRELVVPLHDPTGAQCIEAERALLNRLQGGCHVPLGAYAWSDGQALCMQVFWHAPGSPTSIRALVQGHSVEELVSRAMVHVRPA